MPPVVNYPFPLTFISADWGKPERKRSVHVTTVYSGERTAIEHKRCPAWSLPRLLELAKERTKETRGPALIGVDLALGVPDGYWQEVTALEPSTHFVEWLQERSCEFFKFQEPKVPADAKNWNVDRPFFRVPHGKGGRRRFEARLPGGFRRRIDRLTAANPIWATDIPGSVGSGTAAFWKELRDALRDRGAPRTKPFVVWPFEAIHETSPFFGTQIVIAETYPRLAYAAALKERDLPAPHRLRIPKTKKEARNAVAQIFKELNWVSEHLGSYDEQFSCDEDRFDSFLTAAAVVRCVVEGQPIVSPEWIKCRAEGTMLLAGPVDPCPSEQTFAKWQKSNSPGA